VRAHAFACTHAVLEVVHAQRARAAARAGGCCLRRWLGGGLLCALGASSFRGFLAPRRRGGENLPPLSTADFMQRLKSEVAQEMGES